MEGQKHSLVICDDVQEHRLSAWQEALCDAALEDVRRLASPTLSPGACHKPDIDTLLNKGSPQNLHRHPLAP